MLVENSQVSYATKFLTIDNVQALEANGKSEGPRRLMSNEIRKNVLRYILVHVRIYPSIHLQTKHNLSSRRDENLNALVEITCSSIMVTWKKENSLGNAFFDSRIREVLRFYLSVA